MSERLIVFQAGDRFATMTRLGKATIYVVSPGGVPQPMTPGRLGDPGDPEHSDDGGVL
jgi:hypothetical protein